MKCFQKYLHIPLFIVELILQEVSSVHKSYIHSNAHQIRSVVSYPKLLRPRKLWSCMLMRLENYEGLLKRFAYFSFFSDLLLRGGHFGHYTHTLKHTRTYQSSFLQNLFYPDKDGSGKLN